MATITLGTVASTTLIGVSFAPAWNTMPAGVGPERALYGTPVLAQLPADMATVDGAILDDLNPARSLPPGFGATVGLTRGLLYVPNRGVLQIRPGDYVAYDAATGWPILVSGRAANGAGWAHS